MEQIKHNFKRGNRKHLIILILAPLLMKKSQIGEEVCAICNRGGNRSLGLGEQVQEGHRYHKLNDRH